MGSSPLLRDNGRGLDAIMNRGPAKRRLCGERTNDGMSEFSCLHENEGYEVHEDEGRRCGPWRTILA